MLGVAIAAMLEKLLCSNVSRAAEKFLFPQGSTSSPGYGLIYFALSQSSNLSSTYYAQFFLGCPLPMTDFGKKL
jgi:hypothetical protein